MIRIVLLPSHQKIYFATSPLVMETFGGFDESILLSNISGKLQGFFPDLISLVDDHKPSNLFLKKKPGKIMIDHKDVLISSQNIYFRFSNESIKNFFEVITFASLHINILTASQYKEVKWNKDPHKYIKDFINSLTLNQKMYILETFFYTEDLAIRSRLKLLLLNIKAPIIKRDFDVFTFREHQKRGIDFVLKNQEVNRLSILDYDMGAGKTRMILSLFKNVQGSTISVVKSSLVTSLIAEAKELNIYKELRLFFITNLDSMLEYRNQNNVVITYEALSRYQENYKEKFWDKIFDFLITDESQVLQNHKSKVFNTFINISATRGAFFSGTLIRNSVGDTYYLSYWSKLYTASGDSYHLKMKAKAGNRKLYAMDVNSDFAKAVKENLLKLTISYKNKFKFEVKEYDIPVKLRDEELEYYKLELEEAYRIAEIVKNNKIIKVKKDTRAVFSLMDIISKIPRMMAIASNFKLREELYQPKGGSINIYNPPTKYLILKAILDEFKDKKILIFSALKNVGISYSKMLKKEGYKNMYFDGSIDKDVRFQNVQKFNSEKCKTNIFIATRDSMKYGLNFSNTSIVINLDRSWTPADNEQANARIKRLSQKDNKIIIFNIFSIDTIDEYMKTVNHLKSNAINDFWKKDSQYNAVHDYSMTFTSLFQMIDNLKEGIKPNAKSRFRPLIIHNNHITFEEIKNMI